MGFIAVLCAVALNLLARWSAARAQAAVERWHGALDELGRELAVTQEQLAELRRTR